MIPSQKSHFRRKCLSISWLVRPPEMNQREFFQTAQESMKQPKWVLSHGCFLLNADLDFQELRLSHGLWGMTDWFGNAFSTKVRSRCRLWYKNTLKIIAMSNRSVHIYSLGTRHQVILKECKGKKQESTSSDEDGEGLE